MAKFRTVPPQAAKKVKSRWLKQVLYVATVAGLFCAVEFGRGPCLRALRSLGPPTNGTTTNSTEKASRPAKASEAQQAEADAAAWAVHMAQADAAAQGGDLPAAEAAYRAAISVAPGLSPAYTNLAHVLTARGAFDEALDAARRGIGAAAGKAAELSAAYVNYGVALRVRSGARGLIEAPPGHELTALDAFRQAVEAEGSATALTYLANGLVSVGLLDEALHMALRAVELAPRNITAAHHVVVDVAAAAPERHAAALADMHGKLAEVQAAGEADAQLGFAQFKVAHALGLYDQAWVALVDANARARAAHESDAFSPTATAALLGAVLRTFPAFDAFGEQAPRNGAPLLLVGAAHSSSALIAAALSRAREVHFDGGEHSALGDLVARVGVGFFDDATPQKLRALGDVYVANLHRAVGLETPAKYVVDANVDNVFWVGAAYRALRGRLKVVIMRRNAQDVSFAHYADRHRAWTSDAASVRARLDAVRTLEDHWLATHPAETVRVLDYDALVADPREVLQGLFRWLGVEWSEAALSPQDAPIAMASHGAARLRASDGIRRHDSPRTLYDAANVRAALLGHAADMPPLDEL
ncbi:hypothetical protein M885DRAFT_558343 [Pelagophyceae sp. CCMP2097]|nr:hypothetical protein M885DRAFT_558343 [Pelagophyceae sp. CCMP2097]|mmetsp:Transcript_20192/g.69314  ORF Transcript_20192/g.69314 Transcript_20192/m.69314 type:complete len:587 (+) Transcript_20192:123-1883(+)